MKKFWTLVSFLLIASMALAACTTPATETAAPTEKVEDMTPKGTVTLWHAYQTGSAEESTMLERIEAAKAAFPELTINVLQVPFGEVFNKLQTEIAAGGGPDMFIAPNDDLGNFARADLVMDLTGKVSADKLSVFSPKAIDGMKVEGKLYGIPESFKAVALYYNKSLVPTPPATTDELLAMVKENPAMFTQFIGAYHMFGWGAAFGGKLFDDGQKCIADQGGWSEALTYLKELKDAGAIVESDYTKAEATFRQGEAGMFVNGPWAFGDYRKVLGDNLGVAPIPAGPGGKAAPFLGVDGFQFNPNTTNFDAALELAFFLTNEESQKAFADKAGHLPARNGISSSDPLIAVFTATMADGFFRPQSPEFSQYWSPFSNATVKVMEGASTPADAITEACAAMNAANGK